MIRKQNKNVVIKQISVGLMFIMSLSLFGQEKSSFAKYIFMGINIDYDEEKKRLIKPEDDDSKAPCLLKNKPKRYECSTGQGGASVFLKEDSPGNFETTVFHPAEKGRDTDVSISTVVKDGKVIQQSRCFYRSQWNPQENEEESHFIIPYMECYVVTAEMGNLFATLSGDNFKSEEKFQQFVAILESSEYKEQLLKAQRLNYRNAFLYANRDEKFEYYSKLEKGYYDKNLEQLKTELLEDESEWIKEKVQNISIANFEDTYAVKSSKNLSELAGKAKALMLRVYVKPAGDLFKNNLLKKTP